MLFMFGYPDIRYKAFFAPKSSGPADNEKGIMRNEVNFGAVT